MTPNLQGPISSTGWDRVQLWDYPGADTTPWSPRKAQKTPNQAQGASSSRGCTQPAEPKTWSWAETAPWLTKGVAWHPKESLSCKGMALKTHGFPIAPNMMGCRPQRRPSTAAHPSWWPKLNILGHGGSPEGLMALGKGLLAIWPHPCPFLNTNEAKLPHGGQRMEPWSGGAGICGCHGPHRHLGSCFLWDAAVVLGTLNLSGKQPSPPLLTKRTSLIKKNKTQQPFVFVIPLCFLLPPS